MTESGNILGHFLSYIVDVLIIDYLDHNSFKLAINHVIRVSNGHLLF